MPESIRGEVLEAKLLGMLGMVNDWLKFAEAKNFGIVTIASAAMAALLNYVSGPRPIEVFQGIILLVSGLFLTMGLIAGLLSFFPRTDLAGVLGGKQGMPERDDNLYYFGHLATYRPRHLAEAVARRYAGGGPDDVGEVHLALAAQIVTNARITMWKLRLFGYSVACFGAGVVAAAIGVVLVRLAA